MRRVVLLILLLLLSGCGQVAATATPSTPAAVLQAFRDAGLVVIPDKTGTTYGTLQQPGLLNVQTFTQSQFTGPVHAVAQYDTVEHATAARYASANELTGVYQHGTLLLLWAYFRNPQTPDMYFTVLQLMP